MCLRVHGSYHVYVLVLRKQLKRWYVESLNERRHFDVVHSAIELLHIHGFELVQVVKYQAHDIAIFEFAICLLHLRFDHMLNQL